MAIRTEITDSAEQGRQTSICLSSIVAMPNSSRLHREMIGEKIDEGTKLRRQMGLEGHNIRNVPVKRRWPFSQLPTDRKARHASDTEALFGHAGQRLNHGGNCCRGKFEMFPLMQRL
ncbi:hypothetical protein KHC17_25015 (plasmid) [Agrobacterium salinitolerans]|uniref:hypothetical protein n=1 Tax=Agrobacterium salinitolerans TaxID=1183413 RepID=UPI001C23BF21|nr:hypothetical protein [Agrobacterium salinitolerans]QXC52514.1 hypothetical protein KHC17_25015 [Agrobacterium salinitolerans]